MSAAEVADRIVALMADRPWHDVGIVDPDPECVASRAIGCVVSGRTTICCLSAYRDGSHRLAVAHDGSEWCPVPASDVALASLWTAVAGGAS